MDLRPHPAALVGPMHVSTGAGHPYVPTLTELDLAFGGERIVTGPDPARVTATLWLPDSAHDTHLPRPGDRLDLAVTDELDNYVRVFVGRVDGVKRRRRRGSRTGTPATPLELPPSLSLQEWQGGTLKSYRSAAVADGVISNTMPPYYADGLFTAHPVTVVVPLSDHVDPDTWLWTSDRPDGAYPPRAVAAPPPGEPADPPPSADTVGRSQWWWRANGTHTPVTRGPLVIGETVPPDLALVAYARHGERIRVAVPLARPRVGTVDAYPPGEWLEVTAADDLATLGQHRIGDAPWPLEPLEDRLERIVDAGEGDNVPVPVAPVVIGPGAAADAAAVNVAALDVDSSSMLSVYTEALRAIAAHPLARVSGVIGSRTAAYPWTLQPSGGTAVTADAVHLPAHVVPDTTLESSIDDVTNRVEIRYVEVDIPFSSEPVDRTTTRTDFESTARWGQRAAGYETPAVHIPQAHGTVDAPAALGPVIDRLWNIVRGSSQPRFTFADPVLLAAPQLARLDADPWPGTSILAALNVDTRFGTLVHIDHDLPDLPRDFAVVGGSLIFEDGRPAVTLNLVPASTIGAPIATFGQLAASPSAPATFGGIAELSPDLRFDDLTQLAVL